MKTLRDVPVGAKALVKRIHGEGPLRRRIMDMGITKGTEVYVRKVAPLGDPVELTVRGYELSIRKNEAEAVKRPYLMNSPAVPSMWETGPALQ